MTDRCPELKETNKDGDRGTKRHEKGRGHTRVLKGELIRIGWEATGGEEWNS